MAHDAIDRKMREEALRKLIRDTVDSVGAIAPDDIPHKVKERLKGRAVEDVDLDEYIKEAMAARARK